MDIYELFSIVFWTISDVQWCVHGGGCCLRIHPVFSKSPLFSGIRWSNFLPQTMAAQEGMEAVAITIIFWDFLNAVLIHMTQLSHRKPCPFLESSPNHWIPAPSASKGTSNISITNAVSHTVFCLLNKTWELFICSEFSSLTL